MTKLIREVKINLVSEMSSSKIMSKGRSNKSVGDIFKGH